MVLIFLNKKRERERESDERSNPTIVKLNNKQQLKTFEILKTIFFCLLCKKRKEKEK